MNTAMLLTTLSLTLGLIGAFTKTSKEADNKKIPTVWGYVVAALMLISAVAAIFSEADKQEKSTLATKKQEEEAQQQRLLSLIAVSSNFDIAFDPQLSLAFYPDSNATEDVVQQYEQFPGFGLKGIRYSLEMNLSNTKSGVIEGGQTRFFGPEQDSANVNLVEREAGDADSTKGEPVPLGITFDKDFDGNDRFYLWIFSGYKSLLEFLLDFQDKREIGIITFKKTSGAFTGAEIKQIESYILATGSWKVSLNVKTKHDPDNYVETIIPVTVSAAEKATGNTCRFKLVTGIPKLAKREYFP